MTIHRHALALAAVLAATVLTGGAAILGMTHRPAPGAQTATPAVLVQQAPAPAPPSEEAD